jgi:hypothetical protein
MARYVRPAHREKGKRWGVVAAQGTEEARVSIGWGLKGGGGSMVVVEDDVRESTHTPRVLEEEDAKERTETRWANASFFLP